MDLGKLSVSNGSGEAVRATVTVLRSPGATVITPNSLTNWPTNFVAATGPVLADGTFDPAKTIVFRGHISGSTIIIDELAPGYTDTYGSAVSDAVVIKPATWWADGLVNGVRTSINDNGTLKVAAIQSSLNPVANVLTGWNALGAVPTSITHNGNRSYTWAVSTDYTTILSPGTRLMATNTTAAPTYMSSILNGSSQYFVKTSPTGSLSTVTNNFTVMCHAMPTSDSAGDAVMIGRGDASVANQLEVWRLSTGQVRIQVSNGGSSNYRYFNTYRSLPTNKKTHIAVTWASGTAVVYFDGDVVPLMAVVTSGTAPTTAGTGGDFAVGRRGASSTGYYAGRVSNVGFFSAVLTQATIKSYSTQVLTGAETNCIGAWSLNNTANDQTSTNNLAAQGGATFTSGVAPFATDSYGVATGSLNYGIVQKVTSTEITVQAAEDCTFPVDGVSAVSYSRDSKPQGFPGQKARWILESAYTFATGGATAAATSYNNLSAKMTVPIGEFTLAYNGTIYANETAGNTGQVSTNLSYTAASTTPVSGKLTSNHYSQATGASNVAFMQKVYTEDSISFPTPQAVYANVYTEVPTDDARWAVAHGQVGGRTLTITAINDWL